MSKCNRLSIKILFLCFSASICYGQFTDKFIVENIHILKSKKVKFPNTGSFEQKKKIVDALMLDTIGYHDFTSPDTFALKEYFFLFDIDKDKDLDLVYHGPVHYDEMYHSTIVYLNKKGIYSENLFMLGKAVCFKDNIILQYESPCCAGEDNTFSVYSIKPDSVYLSKRILYFESLGLYFDYPEIPKILPKQLKKSAEIHLATGTKLNCTSKDSIIHTAFMRSNLIGTITAPVKATVYANRKDENGIYWYYCLVPSEFVEFSSHDCTGSFLAWVKQK